MSILFIKLQEALYRLMRASLLFYKTLQKELKEYEFKVNPHDPYIAKMTTAQGEQLTVIWHVGNLISLCIDNFELAKFSYRENIPTALSLCCDSAFAHKKEYSIFKFPKRYLEISCRDLTSFTSLSILSKSKTNYQSFGLHAQHSHFGHCSCSVLNLPSSQIF